MALNQSNIVHKNQNCDCIDSFFRKIQYLKGTTMIAWMQSDNEIIEKVYALFNKYLREGKICKNSQEYTTIQRFIRVRAEKLAAKGTSDDFDALQPQMPKLSIVYDSKQLNKDLDAPNMKKKSNAK